MGTIRDTQDEFKIELTTGIDITGGTAVIKYRSPSNVTDQWAANIINDKKGIIEYDNPLGNFLESGKWEVWAHITRAGGKVVVGDTNDFTIKKEGV